MNRHVALVVALAFAALGLAVAMFPRDKQVGLMTLKDHDFDTARAVYEARWSEGDRSPSVGIPLTEVYLNIGEVDRAVAVLEALVGARPENPQAARILADLYYDAQRFGDLRILLERVAERFPTDANLRELAAFYETHGLPDREATVLARIAAETRPTPDELRRLAGLRAVAGDRRGAAEALRRLDREFPKELTPYDRPMLASLLLDEGDGEAALALAAGWTRPAGRGAAALALSDLFTEHGRPDLALALLQPHETEGRTLPALAYRLIELDVALGNMERARQRLRAALSPPPEPRHLPRLVGLALSAGDVDLALHLVGGDGGRTLAPGTLPDAMLAAVVRDALAAGRRDVVNRLLAGAPDGFYDAHPGFTARLAQARGDARAAAAWAERALAVPGLPVAERIDMAALLASLGRKEPAQRVLDGLDGGTADPPAAMLELLAGLYVALGRAGPGLARMEALRERLPGPEADRAWARLAAAAGHGDAVAAWLGDHREQPAAFLEDLYYAAAAAPDGRGLAVAAASRLHEGAPSARTQRLLGEALVAAGRGREAVDLLRPLLPGDAALEASYMAALQAAGDTAEIARILGARLADPSLTEAQRSEILYGLIDAGAHDAALPFLKARALRQPDPWLYTYLDAAARAGRPQPAIDTAAAMLVAPGTPAAARETAYYALAERLGATAMLPHLRWLADTHGEPWTGTYAETLERLGRRDTLLAWQRERAASPAVPREDRRQIADDLLAAGRKEMAVDARMRLAEAEGPDGPDTRQLVYLWGPRPPPEGLDWLERRARNAATAAEQAGWLAHLADAGADARVIRIVEATGGPRPGGGALAYVRALAEAGDADRLAATVTALAARDRDPERLRAYAQLAESARRREAAEAAWSALHEAAPGDPDALRALGTLAYDRGAHERAERLLRLYLPRRPDDYEASYFYGLTLSALGRESLATAPFRRSLESLRRSGAKDRNARMLEANLLGRLGHTGEALARFEALVRETPGDRSVRADYASLLVQNRMYDRARSVLDAP